MKSNGLYIAASVLGLLTILAGWLFWQIVTVSGPGSEFIGLSGLPIMVLGVLLLLFSLDLLVLVLIVGDKLDQKRHPERKNDKVVTLS